MAKCSLCGGRLDLEKRCTLCGLDNTKNDEQYKRIINKNNCDGKPLTHVHEHSQGEAECTKWQDTKTWIGKKTSLSESGNKKNLASLVGIIVALVGIFSTIYGFVEDAFYEEIRVDVAYETSLKPGNYTAGTHIPEGTYTLTIDSGEWGLVEIQSWDDEEFYMDECFYMSPNEDVVEGVWLGENHVLSIPTGLTLYIYSEDADPNGIFSQINSQMEGYLISQTSVAGVDFPAGVYDIVFDREYPDDKGNVSYQIMDAETGLVMMERSQIIDSDNDVFHNLMLPEGSVIWLEGLRQFIIQPSEVISVTE